ncbi:MAG: carboxypeptidase M32, partial [bacterium]
MTNNTALKDLMAYQRQTEALAGVAGRLGWDQETMMPPGAGEQRGEEMAAMEGILHARRTDPRVGEWLEAADPSTDVERAFVRLVRRSYDRTTKVPSDLAQEIARVTSVAQAIWAKARADDKVADFLPTLAQVIKLKREEAACLAQGGDLYDALIDDYEPGATAATLGGMFDRMRPRLVALRSAVLAQPAPAALVGQFPEALQLKLSRDVATAYGYDWNRGRIDLAVHPFSSGGGNDSRITTRVVESDPFNCIYSTIHEVGHSSYELNISQDYLLTPLGGGVSMGVHESQSRIYENQIGRGRGLTEWLYGKMQGTFGDFGVGS